MDKILDEIENIAIYRMFTKEGVRYYMKLAKFYYSKPSMIRKIMINIAILFVDTYDYILSKIKGCN